MATIHLLSQYVWPDGAPTAIYVDQLAGALAARGLAVILVGGRGSYRAVSRPAPQVPIVRLAHRTGKRGRIAGTFAEYRAVSAALEAYIGERVAADDLVVATTAPPTSIGLATAIRRQRATAIYWLQDYYPEVVRGLFEYPGLFRRWLSTYWDARLRRWDTVVKAAGNLGYDGANAIVIRNWPTLSFSEPVTAIPRTALYSGNLGYCHAINAFVELCRELTHAGYEIRVRGDGPGIAQLPPEIASGPPFSTETELAAALQGAELHLVAADPRIQRGLFPSKIWNSLACGRTLVGSGFAGAMAEELEASRAAPFATHLGSWCDFLCALADGKAKGPRSA